MSSMSAAATERRASLLAALLILTATPLWAQNPLELRVGLFGGVLDHRGDLPDAPILSSPTNVVGYDDFAVVPTFGVGLEMRGWAFPASVRASVSRSFGGEEVGLWSCADEDGDPLPCPSILIEVETKVTTTVATADLVGDVAAGPVTLRPLLGLGWMRHTYTWDSEPGGPFSLAPGRHADDSMVLHYGLGVGVPVGRFLLEAGYAGYRSDASRLRPSRSGAGTVAVSVPVL